MAYSARRDIDYGLVVRRTCEHITLQHLPHNPLGLVDDQDVVCHLGLLASLPALSAGLIVVYEVSRMVDDLG